MAFISDALSLVGLLPSKPTDFAAIGPASAFAIRQKTGPRRDIVLTGRGLPRRPFSLEGGQRTELTWLPGAVEAEVTVLGPDESPTSISGKWSDKFVAAGSGDVCISVNGQGVEDVREAVTVMDMVRREGQLVEVTWDQDLRVGIIKKFRTDWLNAHDVEWTIDFEWIGRGEPDIPAITPPLSMPSASAGILSKLGDLLLAAQDPKFSLVSDFVRELQADVAQVQTLSEGVGNLVQAGATAAVSPLQLVSQGMAVLGGLVTACEMLAAFLQSQVPGAMNGGVAAPPNLTPDGHAVGFVGGAAAGGSLVVGASSASYSTGGVGVSGVSGAATAASIADAQSPATSQAEVAAAGFGIIPPLDTQSFGTRQLAALWLADLKRTTAELRRTAIDIQTTFQQQVRNQVLAIYTAKDGDELRQISWMYYQDPNHWQDIMIFNNLQTSILPRGLQILIPKTPAGQGGAL